MALIIFNGSEGDTGSAVTIKDGAHIIVSGEMGGATVEFTVFEGAQKPANIYTATAPGAVEFRLGIGVTVFARIVGGQVLSSVDVSMV